MAQNAPGKHFREGISLIDLFKKFPDDETAEQWFIQTRWPDGIACPLDYAVKCQSPRLADTMKLWKRILPQGFSLMGKVELENRTANL